MRHIYMIDRDANCQVIVPRTRGHVRVTRIHSVNVGLRWRQSICGLRNDFGKFLGQSDQLETRVFFVGLGRVTWAARVQRFICRVLRGSPGRRSPVGRQGIGGVDLSWAGLGLKPTGRSLLNSAFAHRSSRMRDVTRVNNIRLFLLQDGGRGHRNQGNEYQTHPLNLFE